MYDNGSTDKSRSVLSKYEESGFVHVRDWPHQGAQTEALNDCLCRFRHSTRWAVCSLGAETGRIRETKFGGRDGLKRHYIDLFGFGAGRRIASSLVGTPGGSSLRANRKQACRGLFVPKALLLLRPVRSFVEIAVPGFGVIHLGLFNNSRPVGGIGSFASETDHGYRVVFSKSR